MKLQPLYILFIFYVNLFSKIFIIFIKNFIILQIFY